MRMLRYVPLVFAALLTALLMTACGQPPSGEDSGERTEETTGAETTAQEALTPGEGALVIYSGRSEELVGRFLSNTRRRAG